MSEDVTKAQIESLKEFIKDEFGEIKQRFDKIEKSIESIRQNTVPLREYEKDIKKLHEENKRVDDDLKTVKSSMTWLWRTVAGSVITGIIGAIIVYFSNLP